MIGVFVQLNEESRYAKAHPIGYVIDGNGCWVWVGTTTGDGYGFMRIAGKMRLAHRVMFERTKGSIPSGLMLDHLCRNHGCVNPSHLEIVTHRENCLRGVGVGAVNAAKTHCPNGHLLAGDNLRRAASRLGARKCRVCNNTQRRISRRAQYNREAVI